ncbi:hypothetical protein ASZ78_007076 [Callipepla squamata]|uniref:Uncharacterized protein n=1 Tax=Callipepla squamata TaxID=9009 RepID=A0A226MF33_CALSU|nr:hypothetical protein ASZ78_007076 [Callipepla squamata]
MAKGGQAVKTVIVITEELVMKADAFYIVKRQLEKAPLAGLGLSLKLTVQGRTEQIQNSGSSPPPKGQICRDRQDAMRDMNDTDQGVNQAPRQGALLERQKE